MGHVRDAGVEHENTTCERPKWQKAKTPKPWREGGDAVADCQKAGARAARGIIAGLAEQSKNVGERNGGMQELRTARICADRRSVCPRHRRHQRSIPARPGLRARIGTLCRNSGAEALAALSYAGFGFGRLLLPQEAGYLPAVSAGAIEH